MTIRARLTLWYAGILFGSVLLITGLAYHEFAQDRNERRALPGRKEEDDGTEDLVQIIVSCGIPAAVVGLAGGWWLMRKAMSPVTALTQAAARVHERNLSGLLPRTRHGTEVDTLTEVFNSMIARLAHSFHRIRQFTLHAAHQPKTPPTMMTYELH